MIEVSDPLDLVEKAELFLEEIKVKICRNFITLSVKLNKVKIHDTGNVRTV